MTGKKCRAWRLKKKYEKWFFKQMCNLASMAIMDMSGITLVDELVSIDYSIYRSYLK